MRLLSTETLKLHEFYTDIPPYAILSHTWEKEEVSFQDIQNLETAGAKAGFAKVLNACRRARHYDFEWIWIDSCCINKESSAELSEAINSMYQYYEDAVVCYVYLCDVSLEVHLQHPNSSFRRSRWFKRGWTLQELLAPWDVVFLDKDWSKIGTRWSLRDLVSTITTIPVEVLEGQDISDYSVAQKMSWAAFRKTTRPEDQAYCLMGLFGVSMPPIYGEGSTRAFMRLQQEIIKISDDRSIFAWIAMPSDKHESRGLLASSPYEFRMSGEVKASVPEVLNDKSSYLFGNNGLRIHLPLEPTDSSRFGSDVFLGSLLCQSEKDGSYLSVYLRKTSGQQYVRCRVDELVLRSLPPAFDNVQELSVREKPVPRRVRSDKYLHMASSDTVLYHVELLTSARHFFCASNPHTTSVAEKGFAVVAVDANKSLCWLGPFMHDASLTYECMTTGKTFTIEFAGSWDPVYYNCTLQLCDKTFGDFSDPRMDRIVGQFDSGDYICVTRESRGDLRRRERSLHQSLEPISEKNVEISYIPKESPEANFLTHTLRPSHSGFMVPANLELSELELSGYQTAQLSGVFPPYFFVERFDNMAYVTAFHADGGEYTSNDDQFCILTYTESMWHSSFYVALGLQGSSAWIDIDFCQLEDGENPEAPEDIWKSYLSSGSRVEKRMEAKSSTWVGSLMASVERRTNLQLGSHLLRLQLPGTSLQDSTVRRPQRLQNLDTVRTI
ncbi:hypothetical protein D9758_018804 [Tetrapyrgos nigripes]|uniref:Heterokaryon incompatibility domain-containing protein n=1 Tax=Tetrapyrgos nigripes TaxID=182062 RepID=A0A8H5BAX5_9AGAR|nr:hypothetical protein D9758_018804 [Tetrapyrgos nigripes]